MKKNTPAGMIHIMVFLTVLITVGLCSLLLPKPKVSEYEGRDLAKFPEFSWESLFSGAFTRQIGTYFSDTFPGRDSLVECAAVYKELLGVHIDDVRIHGSVPVINPDPNPNPEELIVTPENPVETPPAVSETAPTDDEPTVELDGEMKEGVFIVGGKAMSLFGGSEAMAKEYAKVISGYQEQFGSKVQIYNMVVPTQAEFALPKKYQDLSASQRKNIDYIYSQLAPSIKSIDAYPKLQEHKKEYIYFGTDHHWTPLGAYYAYEAFCEAAGFTPVSLSDMEIKTKPEFLGSLYRITQDPALKSNPDYMDYYVIPAETNCYFYRKGQRNTAHKSDLYVDYASGTNTYSLFMGGDWPLFKIESNAGTGRSILVVKESFGNAFVPYLASHYDTVYVVDQRYFEKNLVSFVADNNINEVLFINNVFAANTASHINWIKNLNYEKPVVTTTVPTEPPPEGETGTGLSETLPDGSVIPQTTVPDGAEQTVMPDTMPDFPVTPSEEDANIIEPAV